MTYELNTKKKVGIQELKSILSKVRQNAFSFTCHFTFDTYIIEIQDSNTRK